MNTDLGLNDAAAVLDPQAAGVTSDRVQVLAGALALSTLCIRGTADRDRMDAAAGLDALATGRTLELNAAWRAREAKLAARVRHEMLTPAP